MAFISRREKDFRQKSSLDIYEKRIQLIAEMYLNNTSDINTAFEDFTDMYNQIKMEEASLYDKLEVNISFDESAVDELIKQAIKTGQEAGPLAFQMAKRLEYGLKLVKDRSGMMNFTINAGAVTDMERYVNGLVKKYYREDCGDSCD